MSHLIQRGGLPKGQWRVGTGKYSVIVHFRSWGVCLACSILLLALSLVALRVGTASYGFADLWEVLSGGGEKRARLVIVEWRLPRILAGIVVGALLGMSGVVFQTITRNPLGSPDIIGFSMGAQTGILVSVLVFGGSIIGSSFAAMVGGTLAGAVIFALSSKGGFGGVRLILAGIALSAMLGSLNRWLLLQADSDAAYGAARAIAGTLTAVEWKEVTVALAAGGVVMLLLLCAQRQLHLLALGEQRASTLGMRVNTERAWLVILATLMVAIATTTAGPIAFIALLAPHISKQLTGCNTPVVPAAAVGSTLLLGADVMGQVWASELPVGVITAAVGGFYFFGLLLRKETR